jgi:acetyl-CoA carboxylase biotin carboxyl carrier protein
VTDRARPDRRGTADAGPAEPADDRTPEARAADHAAIDRLTDELLPALVARLGATGLGELEVREGRWRVRLRRPPGAERRIPPAGRAAPGRVAGRAHDERPGREGPPRAEAASSSGSGGSVGTGASAAGPGTTAATDPSDDGAGELPSLTSVADPEPPAGLRDLGPLVASSPTVGIVRAAGVRVGARVAAGDRLATVDLLGVPQEVLASGDGIVAAVLVEDGDAVEYGQPLFALEALPGPRDDREAAG